METRTAPQQDEHRSVDVTGLSEDAIRAVEALVSHLRGQPERLGGTASFPSPKAWAGAFREWAESHPKSDTIADDSRESIYADRDE
jgi:hypothetical protein